MQPQSRLFTPSLEEVLEVSRNSSRDGNVIPISTEVSSELKGISLDPVTAFLKLRNNHHQSHQHQPSFLFEVSERSTIKTEYSVIGVDPWKVMEIGGRGEGDPLIPLEKEIDAIHVVSKYKLEPKILNGGAFGFIGYDCVRYFEPKVDRYEQVNALGLPESVFMFFHSFVIFDQKKGTVKVVALCPLDGDDGETRKGYLMAQERIDELIRRLVHNPIVQFEDQDPTR